MHFSLPSVPMLSLSLNLLLFFACFLVFTFLIYVIANVASGLCVLAVTFAGLSLWTFNSVVDDYKWWKEESGRKLV